MSETQATSLRNDPACCEPGRPDPFLRFFTTQPGPYVDMFDGIADWRQQYGQAVGLGIAPRYLVAPLFVMWELTGRCPQNCIYCYNSSPKKVPELSAKRLFQVADQLIAAKVFNVCLSGGEPTMRPEYFNLLEYLVVSGIGVGTVLSGWRIDKERARRIGQFMPDVQISVDGSTAEIHDAVRRRQGSYHDAVQAIRLFRDQGTRVSVAMALTRYNIDDFPNMVRLCEELDVETLRIQKLAISGKAKRNDDIRADEEAHMRVKDWIHNTTCRTTRIQYGDPTQHLTFGQESGTCLLARITAEGHVGPTPYLDVFFGDLKLEDFGAIWLRMARGWEHPRVQGLLRTQVNTENEQVVDRMTEPAWI